MHKMIILIVSVLLVINCAQTGKIAHVKKTYRSYPYASEKYLEYVFAILKVNKKYTITQNPRQFRKILIGEWYGEFDEALFLFHERGYSIQDSMNYNPDGSIYWKILGYWRIIGDMIVVGTHEHVPVKNPAILTVDYYILKKNRLSENNDFQYTLMIHFTRETEKENGFSYLALDIDYK